MGTNKGDENTGSAPVGPDSRFIDCAKAPAEAPAPVTPSATADQAEPRFGEFLCANTAPFSAEKATAASPKRRSRGRWEDWPKLNGDQRVALVEAYRSLNADWPHEILSRPSATRKARALREKFRAYRAGALEAEAGA